MYLYLMTENKSIPVKSRRKQKIVVLGGNKRLLPKTADSGFEPVVVFHCRPPSQGSVTGDGPGGSGGGQSASGGAAGTQQGSAQGQAQPV